MDSDTGQYTCKISNPAGETSCTAALELPSNNPVLLSLIITAKLLIEN